MSKGEIAILVLLLVTAGFVGTYGNDSMVFLTFFVAALSGLLSVPLRRLLLMAAGFALGFGTFFVRYILPAFAL